jgi:preprotein translocase subunit SecD
MNAPKILLSLILAACTLLAADSAQSVFQLRLVEEQAGKDTEEMTMVHPIKNQDRKVEQAVHVGKTVLLDHTAIASAAAQTDVLGNPIIHIKFTEKGRERFADVTRSNIGKQLAIVVDGRLLLVPRIHSEIPGGKADIAGSFSEQEAAEFATKINAAIER